MGTIAAVVYKRLASLLAEKQGRPYSSTLHWLRCRLNFSLLRSAIMACAFRVHDQSSSMTLYPNLWNPSTWPSTKPGTSILNNFLILYHYDYIHIYYIFFSAHILCIFFLQFCITSIYFYFLTSSFVYTYIFTVRVSRYARRIE